RQVREEATVVSTFVCRRVARLSFFSVKIHQHFIFAHFCLLEEHQYASQSSMNESKALVNFYRLEFRLGWNSFPQMSSFITPNP
ncbi:MAG: hypothetical protein KAK02_01980, partial [Desulfobulbaceae bacterium]|nr:hypothetical protein [Desulfobulbaceae bacterium]